MNKTYTYLLVAYFCFSSISIASAGEKTWVYEAEVMPDGRGAFVTKDKDALNGLAIHSIPGRGNKGALNWGPYTFDQPPCKYRAIFRVKVAEKKPVPVMKIYVTLEGAIHRWTKELKGTDFEAENRYQEFEVSFVRLPERWIQLQVDAYGATQVWFDSVKVIEDGVLTEELEKEYPDTREPELKERLNDGEINILLVNGLYYHMYKLEESIGLIENAKFKKCYFGSWGRYGMIGDFPKSLNEWEKIDVIVLADIDAGALGPDNRKIVKEFVKKGGGLFVLGGPFAFGKGRYKGNCLSEILPVETQGYWDWIKVDAEPLGRNIESHPFIEGLLWEQEPVLMWYHKTSAKHGSKVILKVGDDPILVEWKFDKGRVVAFTGTPLGSPSTDKIPFWEWDEWQKLIRNTIKWLAGSS